MGFGPTIRVSIARSGFKIGGQAGLAQGIRRSVEAVPSRASREYLEVLYLAAHESEVGVDAALQCLLASGAPFSAADVKALVVEDSARLPVHDVEVEAPDLGAYDELFSREEVATWAEA